MTPIFSTYPFIDIIMTVSAAAFLFLAAWYDRNGASIPDAVTIPYALVGITMSGIYGRYITAVLSILLLLFTLQPWRPKWMKRVNAFFMRRAYSDGTEEDEGEGERKKRHVTVEERERELDAQAEAFENAHGWQINVAVRAILGLTSVASIFAFLRYMPEPTAYRAVIMTNVSLLLFLALLGMTSNNKTDPVGVAVETEELSALGGADQIVLIGMFGFYGLIPFVYGAAATFLLHIILVLLSSLRKKKNPMEGGFPLLPSIFLAIPIRLYLASVVCADVLNNFSWLIANGLLSH